MSGLRDFVGEFSTRGRETGSREIVGYLVVGHFCEVVKSASRHADDQHVLWDLDPNVLQ